MTISDKNNRSTEINERVKAGNRAYWKYYKLLKNKYISISTKIKVYKTAIRPVIIYGAETMCITEKDSEKLRVLERK